MCNVYLIYDLLTMSVIPNGQDVLHIIYVEHYVMLQTNVDRQVLQCREELMVIEICNKIGFY